MLIIEGGAVMYIFSTRKKIFFFNLIILAFIWYPTHFGGIFAVIGQAAHEY